MDASVWRRYVAVACSQAWRLDVHATEEMLECIETLLEAAPSTGSATVRVLLRTGVGELVVDGGTGKVRIGIRE
jgi:hypothetical protein